MGCGRPGGVVRWYTNRGPVQGNGGFSLHEEGVQTGDGRSETYSSHQECRHKDTTVVDGWVGTSENAQVEDGVNHEKGSTHVKNLGVTWGNFSRGNSGAEYPLLPLRPCSQGTNSGVLIPGRRGHKV